MKPDQRLVTRLPLDELWDIDGPVSARRGEDMSSDDIRALLRLGPVPFVVADIGHPLKWIEPLGAFAFWDEAKAHVAQPGQGIELDAFPDGYAYWVSRWDVGGQRCVIVLEKVH